MSFLSPWLLAGTAAAAVPIVLHLLRRRVEHRVRFSAVAFLTAAPADRSANRRIRQWVLLALRVAALVLLALAFARPFFSGLSATTGRLHVIAVDTSLSMSAGSQLARARQLAHEALRTAAPGDDVAVVTFADVATLATPPTSSRLVAGAAIDAVAPGFGATSYRAALAAARPLFRGRNGVLTVVTDLQAGGWDGGPRASVPDGVRVDVQDVGPLAENLAVTRVRVDAERVIATIANGSGAPKNVRATLHAGGKPSASAAVEIGPRDEAEVTFPADRATGVVQVTVDDPRGIAGDNTRYAFVTGASAAPVLVVTTTGDADKDATYVRHALIAAANGRRQVTGVSTAQLATWTKDRLAEHAAVVLTSSRGLERRARERLAEYVTGGGGLLVIAGPDVDGDVIADVLGPDSPLEMKAAAAPQQLLLAPTDVRHPIFESFGPDVGSLGVVRFHDVVRVSGATCQAIARFTSGDAAVLDCAAGRGRAVVVASDLNNRWNDFPIRASFVPFLDQTVRYLSAASARAEYLVDEVPPGVPRVPGVATISTIGGARTVIVNVDPKESQLDRMSLADFQASIASAKDADAKAGRADLSEQERRQHLWQYVVAAVVLLLCAEGIAAARAA